MAEKNTVIVTLTSYGPRLGNLPTVLDTIFCQTVPPDLVVLNLAHDEIVPTEVLNYLLEHNVEINRVPDTKVYKKLIPTLKKYPDAVVISIDDDWLYPQGMIADFLEIHRKYPNNPISGNGFVYSGIICHCGCASLTKAEYFGPHLDDILDIIPHCPCDDIAYSYFANKAGHPYIVTKGKYFTNMVPYNGDNGYSETIAGEQQIEISFSYLIQKYGELPHFTSAYIEDPYIASLLYQIHDSLNKDTREKAMSELRSTHAFKLGKKILKPLMLIKRRNS